jgi:hypothetical protein
MCRDWIRANNAGGGLIKSTRLPPLQTGAQNLILEEDGEDCEDEDGTTSFSEMLPGDPLLAQKAANVAPKKQMRSEMFCLRALGASCDGIHQTV